KRPLRVDGADRNADVVDSFDRGHGPLLGFAEGAWQSSSLAPEATRVPRDSTLRGIAITLSSEGAWALAGGAARHVRRSRRAETAQRGPEPHTGSREDEGRRAAR